MKDVYLCHFDVKCDIMRVCLTVYRFLSKRVQLPPLPSREINCSLKSLYYIHDKIVAIDEMKWGHLVYFLRYAEEMRLFKEEWEDIYIYIYLRDRHPNLFPSMISIIGRLIIYALRYL